MKIFTFLSKFLSNYLSVYLYVHIQRGARLHDTEIKSHTLHLQTEPARRPSPLFIINSCLKFAQSIMLVFFNEYDYKLCIFLSL